MTIENNPNIQTSDGHPENPPEAVPHSGVNDDPGAREFPVQRFNKSLVDAFDEGLLETPEDISSSTDPEKKNNSKRNRIIASFAAVATGVAAWIGIGSSSDNSPEARPTTSVSADATETTPPITTPEVPPYVPDLATLDVPATAEWGNEAAYELALNRDLSVQANPSVLDGIKAISEVWNAAFLSGEIDFSTGGLTTGSTQKITALLDKISGGTNGSKFNMETIDGIAKVCAYEFSSFKLSHGAERMTAADLANDPSAPYFRYSLTPDPSSVVETDPDVYEVQVAWTLDTNQDLPEKFLTPVNMTMKIFLDTTGKWTWYGMEVHS